MNNPFLKGLDTTANSQENKEAPLPFEPPTTPTLNHDNDPYDNLSFDSRFDSDIFPAETTSATPTIPTASYTKPLPTTSESLLALLQRGRKDNEGYLIHWSGLDKDAENPYSDYQVETDEINRLAREDNIILFEDGLHKIDTTTGIGQRTLNDMNRYWVTITKQKIVTGELIIRLTYKNHPTSIKDTVLKEQLNAVLTKVLDIFISTGVNREVLKNFYIKEILWLETFIPSLLGEDGKAKGMVVQGDIKRDGSVFLRILEELGFIVVYRTMEGTEIGRGTYPQIAEYIYNYKHGMIDRGIHMSPTEFEEKLREVEQKQREEAEVVTTVASEAQQEIIRTLHADDTGIFRDWQFENYEVDVKRLKTAYEELYILWKEPASMRSGFAVNSAKEQVVIPSIISEISGVPENLEQYWIIYDEFTSAVDSTIIKIEESLFPNNVRNVPRIVPFDKATGFAEDAVRRLPYYQYGYLREGLQKQLLRSLNTVLLSNPNISMEDIYLVLHVALNLPEEYLDMLQQYDYVKEIPKLIVYRSGREPLSREDAVVVDLLHELGVDILFFIPSGYSIVGNAHLSTPVEKHRLYTVNPNLAIPTITQRQPENENEKPQGLFKKLGNWMGL